MIKKPIAVLGGGSGGHTMAADLTLAGYDITFYEHPDFEEKFKPLLQEETVELEGIGRTGVAKLNKVTTDIEEAVKDVDIINIVIPALGHDLFFEELIPHLKDGHIVVLWAGDFGSLKLDKMIKDKGIEKDVTIVEANTLPYGTRLKEPGEVNLVLQAEEVIVSALPSNKNQEILPLLKELYPDMINSGENVLKVALSNLNPICHPPGSLLNVGRIQYSNGNFYMYDEGITEAVAGVIKDLYEETVTLGEALDFEVLKYDERDFKSPGTVMSTVFVAPFNTQKTIGDIKGPKSIYDRYITEDLPCGLVPMSLLGDKLGVSTPLIDSIITLGSHVCDIDFWEKGRTLQKLGLEDKNKDEILTYVNGS